jgi:hypothetical protein
MRRVTTWGFLAAVGLATLLVEPPAYARGRAKVEWVRVDVPEREDSARVQKLLKQALAQAARKANFGKGRTVSLTARVVELSVVVGGAGARSRISYGGSPEKREALEKEVLTQVANGLVARLAQIVRTAETR